MRTLSFSVALCIGLATGCAGDDDAARERADSRDDRVIEQPASPDDEAAIPTASKPSVDAAVAASLPAPSIRFQSCDAVFECGSLTVPIDYGDPAAGTLELYVKRRRARGARLGALLVNPGGPGASAVDYLPGFTLQANALLERFDLVAFDPRGVGRSAPLDCHSALLPFYSADPSPDDEAEWTTITEAASSFAAECDRKHRALLPHLGTPNVARDMDRLRAALGEARLNYLGYSYGTAIGAWYAELFPDRVRALVLDGAVDLTLSAVELSLEQARGFEDTLKRYFSWCSAGQSRCTWTRNRTPSEAFDALQASVEQQPLAVDRAAADRMTGPGELVLGVVRALYGGEATWRSLSSALAAAQNGDGTALVRLADAYLQRRPDKSFPNIQEANQAVNCLDMPAPPVDALRAEAARFRSTAKVFGMSTLTGLLICAKWPVVSTPPPPPTGKGAAKVVVIGTTGDPATPYAWAERMADQLASGVLLTFEGEGHTAYGRGNACLDGAVNAYFLAGTVPPEGTRCGRAAPATSDGPLPLLGEPLRVR